MRGALVPQEYFLRGAFIPPQGGTESGCNKADEEFLRLHQGMTYIENIVTGGTNKKPFSDIPFFFKHTMKTILITTRRANFKFIFHCYSNNFIIHRILLTKI